MAYSQAPSWHSVGGAKKTINKSTLPIHGLRFPWFSLVSVGVCRIVEPQERPSTFYHPRTSSHFTLLCPTYATETASLHNLIINPRVARIAI